MLQKRSKVIPRHNTGYDCGNLKPLAERTEISLVMGGIRLFRGDEEDQSAGAETQASVPVVVRYQQIQTRSQREYGLTAEQFGEKEGFGKRTRKERGKERRKQGNWWVQIMAAAAVEKGLYLGRRKPQALGS